MENKRKKTYFFTLHNIIPDKVERKYGLCTMNDIITNNNIIEDETQITKIIDLNKTDQQSISFLDESKRQHVCNVISVDFNDINNYSCFWCNYPPPDQSCLIGCPIRYKSSQAIKKYYSEISRDKYIIKENITKDKRFLLEEEGNKQLSLDINEHYDTDGIFCSFNCSMAFIKDNKKNPLYSDSEYLLIKYYNDIFDENICKIEEAPHWRLLKNKGGDLTIEEFRNGFNKISYDYYGIVKNLSRPIGLLYENKIKF